jgi:serine/threonine protein kinase
LVKLLDNYLLLRELARSATSAVWLAYDEARQREVAVKLLPEIQERQLHLLEGFLREFSRMKDLHHPHLVQVDNVAVDASVPFIVMELLHGERLADRLARSKPMTIAAFLPIFLQAARALEALHEARLVHHGIRPTRIFMARRGVEQIVKLIGFSNPFLVARPDQRGETLEDYQMEDPQYMSPEQVMAADADHRTDLWSLGVVAYESLTGQAPFTGRVFTTILEQICQARHQPPSAHADGLSPEVDEFFARALAKDPAERFGSAREMAAAFAALAADTLA